MKLFTSSEIIEIANETSDSLGNLYRLDFIARIEHEASEPAPAPSLPEKHTQCCFGAATVHRCQRPVRFRHSPDSPLGWCAEHAADVNANWPERGVFGTAQPAPAAGDTPRTERELQIIDECEDTDTELASMARFSRTLERENAALTADLAAARAEADNYKDTLDSINAGLEMADLHRLMEAKTKRNEVLRGALERLLAFSRHGLSLVEKKAAEDEAAAALTGSAGAGWPTLTGKMLYVGNNVNGEPRVVVYADKEQVAAMGPHIYKQVEVRVLPPPPAEPAAEGGGL